MGVYAQLSALSDPTRVRILALLERQELGVGEVARVLRAPQSTVSRHVKILRAGGWLQVRTEGTAHLLRYLGDAVPDAAQELWSVVRREVDYPEDVRRLEHLLATRRVDAREYFGRTGAKWDAVKRDLYGDSYALPTLAAMLPPGTVVADLGCGTGEAAALLARSAARVLAVDREAQMVEATRQRTVGMDHVEVHQGEVSELPLPDACADAALCMLVLHYVDDPSVALAEAARVLRPGGHLVLLDLVAHDREEYLRTMGHVHLGFSEEDLRRAAAGTGLALAWREELPAGDAALGPPLFLASLALSGPR